MTDPIEAATPAGLQPTASGIGSTPSPTPFPQHPPLGVRSPSHQCDGCGARELGDQRCVECGTFMRKIGVGGLSPCCGEPISVEELLNP